MFLEGELQAHWSRQGALVRSSSTEDRKKRKALFLAALLRVARGSANSAKPAEVLVKNKKNKKSGRRV